ncbi:MAG TPA: NADH-ubiquinone oxidoreductase-F iron-sulfur binding region domain-containing protein, partial [Miltoncostaeaceae bacterium]|nr:NADH-ubiquinone oxidoreductase-F iron-sulfur binding region domain-containing protein [Miltoncostaeaceae bacterium]
IAVSRGAAAARSALERALAERRDETRIIRLEQVPERFVAGEERALVHWLNSGPAKPTAGARPFQRGVHGRPTLVQNVETLANVALIARYGPDWFRAAGTDDEPGTVLATLLGGVGRPGVVETEPGVALGDLVARAGGTAGRPAAVLLGGYFGAWIPASALDLPFTTDALGPLGARVVAVLPEGTCGLAETARVVRWLAGESARQCGPCRFGLPAVAGALEGLASGASGLPALRRLEQLGGTIAGRGACAHPDGVVRLVRTALDVFAAEVSAHLDGCCSAAGGAPVLPVPRNDQGWR